MLAGTNCCAGLHKLTILLIFALTDGYLLNFKVFSPGKSFSFRLAMNIA